MSERPDLLTIDAGNSTLDCLSPGGARLRLATRAPDVAALARFARESGATRVAAVAVVEAARAAIEQAVQGAGLRLRVGGAELPCPLPAGYDTPATLG
ncbi:MAG: hypothetical protein KDE27_12820, partial [Planctomycetes bacterium]|nr:hypothetical protein [Planctomycetota bacterium]